MSLLAGAAIIGSEILGSIGEIGGGIRESITGEKERNRQRTVELESENYNNRLNREADLRRLELTNESEERRAALEAQKLENQANRDFNANQRAVEREDRIARENADREERKALVAAKQLELAQQMAQNNLQLASQESMERARINAEIVKQNRAYAYENVHKVERIVHAGQAARAPISLAEAPRLSVQQREAPQSSNKGGSSDLLLGYAAAMAKESFRDSIKKEFKAEKEKEKALTAASENAALGSAVKESTVKPVKTRIGRGSALAFGRFAKKTPIEVRH